MTNTLIVYTLEQCEWEKVLFEFVRTLTQLLHENTGESQISYSAYILTVYMYMYMLFVCYRWRQRLYIYLHVQPLSACVYINMHMCIHVVPVYQYISERRFQAYAFKHTTNEDTQ